MPLHGLCRAARRAAIVSGAFVLSASMGLAPALAADEGQPATASASSGIVDQVHSRASSGDVAGAIRDLQPYVAAHPRDAAAGRYLGDLYVLGGNGADAERAYLAVLAVASADRETHDRLGNLYASQDKLDAAIAQFELSLPDVTGYSDLVRAHKRRGDLASFVERYRRSAEEFPNDVSAQFAYGVILHQLHRPNDALPYLQTAARDNPRSCAALTEVGTTLLDLDDAAGGMKSLNACLAIDPNDYSALVDLGSVEPNETGARQLLDRAVGLRPYRPEAYVDIGFLDDADGHHDVAVGNYRHALAIDPYCRGAYVNLGYDQLQGGNLMMAETTFLRGLSASNDDGRIEYLLGETFDRQGKRELARREYQSALRSDEPEVAAAAAQVLATKN